MFRWTILVLLCGLLAPAWAGVDIIDLPDAVSERYDLEWEVTVQKAPTAPLIITLEKSAAGQGYQVQLAKDRAVWQQVGVKSPLPPVQAPLSWQAGNTYLFSVKRRQETVALLLNHRLLFAAPAPGKAGGNIVFSTAPAGLAIRDARYREVGKPLFGDDFMRPPDADKSTSQGWREDDIWKVAFYRKDNPAQDPTDPTTHVELLNPWHNSIFGNTTTSANGFWFLYRGVGPSWVVAAPSTVYPSWDEYFVEAAIKPEFDSEIGLIAAYQDNKNYLLFRWKQRDFTDASTPRTQLIAVIDGKETVLASGSRGFSPGQWYRLRINLGWRQVQALVDDEVILKANNPGPIEGRVGLYANGAKNPRRPKVDDATATMYVTRDISGAVVRNDAADAQRTASLIYFDDIRMGEWTSIPDLLANNPYTVKRTGAWATAKGVTTAKTTGRVLSGPTHWRSYTARTRVKVTKGGSAGLLFHMSDSLTGYAWVISTSGQKLVPITRDAWQQPVDRSPVGVKPGEWADLRVETDGPYVALYFNSQQVMAYYDPSRATGRCGLLATSPQSAFGPLVVGPTEKKWRKVDFHESFGKDRYLVTWSSVDADWFPVNLPANLVTPAGVPHAVAGAAAPLPTNQPGLYWHKGGHYHRVRVTVPVTKTNISGQTVHLARNYQPASGYRIVLNRSDKGGTAQLLRGEEKIGEYPFTVTQQSQLVIERHDAYLLLTMQEIDPEDTAANPEVLKETLLVAYRDPKPLKSEMVGFTVTSPILPAANVAVESDRIQDTFEKSPAGWLTESGVWAVMARYSCQPQWNWFGGFGAGVPTVWSKYRLDGDQTVEAYMGIKMQYDDAPEEYGQRYRDVNVTICADGSHQNSGYTVIRAGKPAGQPVTMFLRKGEVIWRTTEARFLLPGKDQGHRQWFATRLEKRGNEIKVFLDNRLAYTYVDKDPLPGGYAGFWTINNGMMIGRVNLSAEKMTVGSPRAAAPLAVQENLEPLATPTVLLDGLPLSIATFEGGLDGWKERPGLTGRLVRERMRTADGELNTILKVVNTFPAGDLSVTVSDKARDLTVTPMLHVDYCFDPGAQINLYVRKGDIWYEIILTGKEASEAKVYTAGKVAASADGSWHHLAINLHKLLEGAITKKMGSKPADLLVQEILVADWSKPAEVRHYGFGQNPGGLAIRFDNLAFTPVVTQPVTLSWSITGNTAAQWRTRMDTSAASLPKTETSELKVAVPYEKGLRFFHLRGKTADGKWSSVVHVPIYGEK